MTALPFILGTGRNECRICPAEVLACCHFAGEWIAMHWSVNRFWVCSAFESQPFEGHRSNAVCEFFPDYESAKAAFDAAAEALRTERVRL